MAPRPPKVLIPIDPMEETGTPTPIRACPRCGRPVDVRSRHVIVTGRTVRMYCSAACRTAAAAAEDAPLVLPPEDRTNLFQQPRRRRRQHHRIVIAVGLATMVLAPHAPKSQSPGAVG